MHHKRSMTPPPCDHNDQQLHAPLLTADAPREILPRTRIPPSPGGPRLGFYSVAPRPATGLRAPPDAKKRRTTAGVQKPSIGYGRTKVSVTQAVAVAAEGKKTTGIMDLPGELRNLIYSYTADNSRQALLVHRPRLASLRPRTRLDRHRTLASDILDKEHDETLAGTDTLLRDRGASARRSNAALLARETNRPFFGLTQVCRQLRQEFRPMYMQHQEIGMDLLEVVAYLQTFYPEAAESVKNLSLSCERKIDMPFTGNLTVAVGDKVKDVEKSAGGIDVWPLLDVWANSFKIEAGFGRYMQADYNATADGEAKDLYRLFGRHVQPDRRCSGMNTLWRAILRTRSLASIRIHRQPAGTLRVLPPHLVNQPVGGGSPQLGNPRVPPYIHILFKPDCAEAWMTKFESPIPDAWLDARGFGTMEHFEIKIGVAL